jgi:glycosyltransferase involved in cell wall biosynthesis
VKRILHILPQFQPGGGMERVVMNYFSQLNHDEFLFDVVTHKMEDRAYADVLSRGGGETFVLPLMSFGNIRDIAQQFNDLLDGRHYDVIHCHMANSAFIYLRIAKKHNIPIRILHSHQDHYADTRSHVLRNMPLIAIGKRYANRNVACSQAAGTFLFGRDNYSVLTNSIDIDIFRFSASSRKKIRDYYGFLDGQMVFGLVGRLTPQKNPVFALNVFAACRADGFPDAKLVIAGEGELHDEMLNHAKRLHIDKDILWLGNTNIIAQIDQAIDVLLMPSLYEGLPMGLVEAQASGMECFVSDTITAEAIAGDFVHFLSISKTAQFWARYVADTIVCGTGTPAIGRRHVVHGPPHASRFAGYRRSPQSGIREVPRRCRRHQRRNTPDSDQHAQALSGGAYAGAQAAE